MRFVPRAHPNIGVELLAALRRGEVVALQGDRAIGTRGDIMLPFFGRPAPFPLGPFLLARAAGVPGPRITFSGVAKTRAEMELGLAEDILCFNVESLPELERLSAVVLLFDQQGQFITSAKAPIDFLKLTAGDESPFVVKMAAPQTVARYRVSFRTDEGTVPHVDRRGEPPVSAPVALTGK